MKYAFSRADRSYLGTWWWTIDRPLLGALGLLFIFGLILVFAASPSVAQRIGLNEYHFIKRHIIFLIPTISVMIGMSFITPKFIRRIAILGFIGSLFAVLLTLFVGSEIKGATRWIRLFGLSLQPSEFLKPCFAVASAWFMSRQIEKPEFPGISIAAGMFALSLLLLVLQPDIGMSFLLVAIWGVQIFLAGFPWKYILSIIGAGVVGLTGAYFGLSHFKSRIDRFLNPESGDTYQIDKALEAFSSGSLIGVGPGQGDIKLRIPDAHADFVFAVAGEELGLIFVLILITIYAFILLRGMSKLKASRDIFVILAAGSLLTMFGLQAFIHMGSNLHLLPTKGMTLPFVSYGGSSMIALGLGMGMFLGLIRKKTR